MRKIIALCCLLCLMGCVPSQKEDDPKKDESLSLKNVVKKNIDYDVVKPIYKTELENWAAYRNVDLFLEKYKLISPNEALNNALELQDLTLALKDNINVEILKTPSFQARLNVLHNEVLRLSDMTYISAIKADEVNDQVEKILIIFSAINNKINTVFTREKFESEITVKDIFIGLDSTKLDTASLRSIRNQKLKIKEIPNKKVIKKN